MSIIEKLQFKYNLTKNSYYKESPYKRDLLTGDEKAKESEVFQKMIAKWRPKTPAGWYGLLGLGSPTPLVWYSVIDEFLDYVQSECPDFEIYQIKIKFGGARIYLGNITNQISDECLMLEGLLYDDYLIY